MRRLARLGTIVVPLVAGCTNPPELANTTDEATTTGADDAPPASTNPGSTAPSTTTPVDGTTGTTGSDDLPTATGDPESTTTGSTAESTTAVEATTTGTSTGPTTTSPTDPTTTSPTDPTSTDPTSTGFTSTGVTSTGFTSTGFTSTGFTSTGFTSSGTGESSSTTMVFIPPDPLDESDEFDNSATLLSDWLNREVEEGTPGQIDELDISTTIAGAMRMIPLTSGWYDDYDGPFIYKTMTGDFMMETHVSVTSIATPGEAPEQPFNSAGIMLRDPASAPGSQNWILYNTGFQLAYPGTEAKITVDSASTLFTTAGLHEGVLRICRYGGNVTMIRKLDDESDFTETDSFPDTLPDEVQVGMAVTAWNTTGQDPDFTEDPDMIAVWEYVRFYPVDNGDEVCYANF